MVTQAELEKSINDLGTATKNLSELLGKVGNVELLMAFREHALKGYYHFCQECSLITQNVELEDIE